jgi:hypothetical protein
LQVKADTENHRIQKVLSGSTTGTTIAGTGVSGSDSSRLYSPNGVYVDLLGNLYIADTYNHRIQKLQNGPQVYIPAGATTGTIKIKGIPDALTEGNETAVFSILASANALLQNTAPQTLTIKDGVAYCASNGVSSREYINRFAITGIVDTTTGNNNGYGDYRNLILNLKRNTSYNLSIYPAWIGTARSEVYAVWIDYNNDADFLDAGEQVFSRAKTTVSPVTGTFTVPVSAVIGSVRMRVSMKYNTAPTSCETGLAGEVEDYTISITDVVALDVQPPTTPLNLSASNVTSSSVDLSWSASTDNVKLTRYDIYRNGNLSGSATTTKATISGLNANTLYSFYVKAVDSAGNASTNSNQVDTTTLTATYCITNSSTTLREYINRFQLGTINNTSGANATGYGNYLSLSTNLLLGSTNTATIIPGWNGTARSEGYRVWIDFNRDGDFADAGEQVFNQAKTTATSISGSILIPATVTTGTTRMRVIIKYNTSPIPCETAGFAGEVEDYTVNITAAAVTGQFNRQGILSGNDQLSFDLYPNPVHQSEVLLKLNGLKGEQILIYDIRGNLVIADRFVKRINVSNLANGTYFVVIVEKGQLWRRKLVKR